MAFSQKRERGGPKIKGKRKKREALLLVVIQR